MGKIKQDFNLFTAQVFEKICMEHMLEQSPLEIEKIGRWWNNREEIDIVALCPTALILGECKWWEEPGGLNVLKDLEQKSELVPHEGRELYFALFSKHGFTPELIQKAKEEKNIFLYDFL
jgi:AAA+ ATPase superfamily predicted ATPase